MTITAQQIRSMWLGFPQDLHVMFGHEFDSRRQIVGVRSQGMEDIERLLLT